MSLYFEKMGMDTSFHSVYEESKLLTDYYEKQRAEEYIQEKAEQVIGSKKRLEIDMDQQRPYEVFDRIYEEGMREKKVKQDRNGR